MTFWRDVDSLRPRFGWVLSWPGGELYVGRRLYRWRWLP